MDNVITVLQVFISPSALGAAIGITVFGLMVGFLLVKAVQTWTFTKGERKSRHQYTAGGRGDYFFNADLMHSTAMGVELGANWIAEKIKELKKSKDIDKLAFIEEARGPVGLLTQKDLLVSRTRIPGLIVRIKRRLRVGRVIGDIKNGESVALISDTGTTGRKITKAINCLQELGLNIKVPYALVLVNLNRGAEESLKEIGTQLISYKKRPAEKSQSK